MNAVPSSILFSPSGLGLPATRLSVSPGGQPAEASVFSSRLSGDGRFASMTTNAENLAPGDHNSTTDIVRLDRTTGQFDLVSVSSQGEPARHDDASFKSSISQDGNRIAFESWSQTLDDKAQGRDKHIYVRDVAAGTTERVTKGLKAKATCEDACISADGQTVVFTANTEEHMRGFTHRRSLIYAYDCGTQQLSMVSVGQHGEQPNDSCSTPVVSADGRYVAFASRASNLVPNDANGNTVDVFLRDRLMGTTRLISQSSGASHSPAMSADGSVVAFVGVTNPGAVHLATNVVIYDAATGSRNEIPRHFSGGSLGEGWLPSLSADGRFVSFLAPLRDSPSPDQNNVLVFDRQTWQMSCVSTNAAGTPANKHCHNPHIAPDGSAVTYSSDATNLVDMAVNGEQVYLSPNPLHADGQARALAAAEQQARAKEQAAGSIEPHDTFVIINGVKVERRTGASHG